MGPEVIEFGGLAVVYGAAASLLILAGLWMFGHQQHLRVWPLLFATLTFVFLTQHPFPPLNGLVCPVETAQPQLSPFKFLDSFWRLHARDAQLQTYLTNRVIAASAMNFLLCVVIGLALARHTISLRISALYGSCLSLAIELTQLTGSWGVYPCAYRQFNVDDLILNISGVVFGTGFAAFWRFERRFPD